MKKLILLLMILEINTFAKDMYYKSGDSFSIPVTDSGIYLFFDKNITEVSNNYSYAIKKMNGINQKSSRSIFLKYRSGRKDNSLKFITDDRDVITLNVFYRKIDSEVKNKNEYTFINKNQTINGTEKSGINDQLRLMKAMINSSALDGYSIYNRVLDVKDGHESLDSKISAIYKSKDLVGYIIKLKSKEGIFNVRDNDFKLGSPNTALLHYINKNEIRNENTATLFVIANNSSSRFLNHPLNLKVNFLNGIKRVER